MTWIRFTEAELDLIFDYFQDPSGTGPKSKMTEYLEEKNLWPVYETAIEKIKDAQHEGPLNARVARQRFLADEPIPDNILEIIQIIEEVKVGRKNYVDEFAISAWCIVKGRPEK